MTLRELRLSRALSQEELADMAGLNVRTIQRIESGSTPSIESLKCIADSLDVEFTSINQGSLHTDGLAKSAEQAGLDTLVSANQIILFLLLATAFLMLGSSTIAETGQENSSITGAVFYLLAATCYLISGVKMLKGNIGLFNSRKSCSG